MEIVTAKGVPVPPLNKVTTMRAKIIHRLTTMRADESAHITVPTRSPREVQNFVRTIATQRRIKIICRNEGEGVRVWIKDKPDA